VGNEKVLVGMHFIGLIFVPSFIKIGQLIENLNGRHTPDIVVSKAYVSSQE
jgi:hypothetical protein